MMPKGTTAAVRTRTLAHGPRRRPGTIARVPWALLATLAAVTFLVTSSGIALSPFLLDMARDLGTGLAAVANLVAAMSVSWGVMSVAAGAVSDRIGRRPILALAVVTLGAARLGLALSTTYGAALGWSLLAGIGGGSYMGTVFAAVSDRVAPGQRGRALGWVLTGQSLSLVLGVPLVTLLGALGGWRTAVAAHAAATLLAAAPVWLLVPRGGAPAPVPGGRRAALRALVERRVLALLGASTTERVCFAATAVYLATFLLTAYRVPMEALAGALALVAAGNLLGNLLGGWVADRVTARPLAFAAASVVSGALVLPLLAWPAGLAVSVALGFGYSLANAAARPPLMAALAEVPPEVRGAVLGLNITMSSVGWLGATALGGWLVAARGFGSLGAFAAAIALAGSLLALLAARSHRA
jgi:predicted MFS family arabinose efflux permease